MVDKESNEYNHSLLGIIERLVDNLQSTNNSNTELLNSVNLSLLKLSETMPEIKEVSHKLSNLSTEITKIEGGDIIKEVREVSTKMKIFSAVLGVVLSLGMTILGLVQYETISEITNKVRDEIKEINNAQTTSLEKSIQLFMDRK
jgi:hypothetical protein